MKYIKVVGFKFEPRDIWLGLYWKDEFVSFEGAGDGFTVVTFFICVIPMLPFIIKWTK